MNIISESILAILVGSCIVALSSCAGSPPIKKGCSEIGSTANGVKLYEKCEDL